LTSCQVCIFAFFPLSLLGRGVGERGKKKATLGAGWKEQAQTALKKTLMMCALVTRFSPKGGWLGARATYHNRVASKRADDTPTLGGAGKPHP